MNPASPTPTAQGPDELAKRIGTLFVLALQSNDAELRHAAFIDRSELGMQDGPVFLPVARLTAENGRLSAAVVQAAFVLQEAANVMRPQFPGLAEIYVKAAHAARASLNPAQAETGKEEP